MADADALQMGCRIGYSRRVQRESCIKPLRNCPKPISRIQIGGTAITDASRIVARKNLTGFELVVKREDGSTEKIRPLRTRPIKEAMVTVGGVALDEIDSQTLESKKCPSLYFAGEVLDIDGPTGGYNLQAAFSTARLAVAAIGKRCGKGGFKPMEKPSAKSTKNRKNRSGSARRPGRPADKQGKRR